MSKISALTKLVNISDTSDSETSSDSEKGKSRVLLETSSKQKESLNLKPERVRVRSRSRDRSLDKAKMDKSRSPPVKSRNRDRSRSHERSRSRELKYDRRRHERRHSSEDRYRRRSHSPKRSRDHRRERSRSPRRRHHRCSPSRSNRGHKTMSTLEKLGIELKPPEDSNSLPSYYNRMAINPAKYAEQMAKRKLIWGSKAETTETKTNSPSLWQGATFSQDQDGKLTAKFKRLMGIKGEAGGGSSQAPQTGQDLIKRQQELFSSMEIQYEAARQATHTQRGVGLGFSSSGHHHLP